MDSKARFIYQDLLNRIVRGDLAGKPSLPTELVLADQYHCSRPTLRKALEELKQGGYITSVRGSGAYINRRPEEETVRSGNLFGIIFPNMGNGYFFDPLCSQLTHYAAHQGDSVVWSGYISPRSDSLKYEIIQICERYIAQRIAGLFFAPFEYFSKGDVLNREITDLISDAGIPVVLIDSNIAAYPTVNDFDLVSMDHIQAAYLLTEHLLAQGYTRIFFLAPPDSHHTIKLRLMGYHEALFDHRMKAEPLVELYPDDPESVSRFIKTERPEALICSNDITAISFINSVEKQGLKVPGDLAVAGFDHLCGATPFSRPVTSIEQPIPAITKAALELMLNRIADPHRQVSHITFPGRLFIEETTL
jgi:DNA-binding LacI/PurR family transcriptional regulator